MGSLDDLILEILTRHYRAAMAEMRQAIDSVRAARGESGGPHSAQSPRMNSLGALRAERAARDSTRRVVRRVALALGVAAASIAVLGLVVSPSTWFGGPGDLSAAIDGTGAASVASVPLDPSESLVVDVAEPTSAAAPGSARAQRARAPLEILPRLAPLAPAEEAPLTTVAVPIYRIQPGDTLYAIASRFGTTTAALAALNGLTDPNLIVAGGALQIP